MPVPVVVAVQAVAPLSEVVPFAKPVKSSSQKALAAAPAVTVTDCDVEQPFVVSVTVTVYVPAVVTAGFCAVLVKLFGPDQLYLEVPGADEVAPSVRLDPQPTEPPVAVTVGPV